MNTPYETMAQPGATERLLAYATFSGVVRGLASEAAEGLTAEQLRTMLADALTRLDRDLNWADR